MLTIDKFPEIEKLVRERTYLMEFLAAAKVATAASISVPSLQKDRSLFSSPCVWLEDERISSILVVAQEYAATRIAKIEAQITAAGVSVPE